MIAAQVVQGNHGGKHAIHDALGDFVAVRVDDRVVGHQMPHVAHEHHAAAGQYKFTTVGCGKYPVRVEAAGEGA